MILIIPQDSLKDMDRALKHGYPSHLSHKLEDRRTQCLRHLSVDQKGKDNPASKNPTDGGEGTSVGPLSFGICPQAVVGFSPEKGRHLVAVERISAGEVLLHDRPYSCVLIPGMEEVQGKGGRQDAEGGVEHRRCHRCLTETLSPVPCEGCSYTRYCSTSCQRDAWEEHHQWECSLGADLMVMGVMSQLALRVTLKAGLKNIQMAKEPIRNEHTEPESRDSKPPDPCASHYGDTYRSVFHLQHHLNRHSPCVRFLNAITIATLYLKLSKAGPPPASWDISRPLQANSHPPDEEGGIGAAWNSELWLMGSVVLRHMLQLRCNAQAIITLQDTGELSFVQVKNQDLKSDTLKQFVHIFRYSDSYYRRKQTLTFVKLEPVNWPYELIISTFVYSFLVVDSFCFTLIVSMVQSTIEECILSSALNVV